ncbi:MAG: BatD family protein [Bacteroidales bacterium]
MKKLISVILFILVVTTYGFAGDTKFSASAPRQVVAGQQFRIVYTLSNGDGKNLQTPDFPGMNVLYGPAKSQSSQFSIINGKTTSTSEESYTYTLTASKEGTYIISPAIIISDGRQYKSNSLSISVLPPDKTASVQQQGASNDEYRGGQQQAGSGTDDKTFARLSLSRTSVYEQEAILATIKIYTKAANIRSLDNATFPSFEGFVVQDIPIQNPQIELEHFGGERYSVVTIKRALLYPQHTGKITIDPGKFVVAVQVIRPVRGFFGMMQGYEDIEKRIQTQSVAVDVKPLPSGKPTSFANAVGNFTISSVINTTSPKTNEALTLKLKISGKGNLKYIKDPSVEFPADFEVYDPKTDVSLKTTLSGVEGVRTVEYTAIPRSAGEFTIRPVHFSYFDINTKTYKTLTTQGYTLNVEKGKDGAGTNIANFTEKEALKMLNQDIRYIKSGNLNLEKSPEPFYGMWQYWLYYILPILAFAIYVIINRKQAKENANITLVRTRKANKVASKRLKVAGKYLKEHNIELFYSEMLKAVWGYLSDKLTLPISELDKENVAMELDKYGLDENTIESFIEILNTCEFAQYAPSQSDDAMDKLYADTVAAIGKMENFVKK